MTFYKQRLTSSNRVNVGIICACLPTIRPIISRFFPHLLDSCPNNERYNSQTLRHDSSSPPQPNPSQVKYDAEQVIEAGSGSTITVVEAGEQGLGHTRDTTIPEENGRDIYVMTSMRQDFMERTPAVWQLPHWAIFSVEIVLSLFVLEAFEIERISDLDRSRREEQRTRSISVFTWMIVRVTGVIPTLNHGHCMLFRVQNKGNRILYCFICSRVVSWVLHVCLPCLHAYQSTKRVYPKTSYQTIRSIIFAWPLPQNNIPTLQYVQLR